MSQKSGFLKVSNGFFIKNVGHTLTKNYNGTYWPLSALWILNCMVYSAVIEWIIVSGIKPLRTAITPMDNRRGTWKQSKWLIELDEEILQLRRLISQCCAER